MLVEQLIGFLCTFTILALLMAGAGATIWQLYRSFTRQRCPNCQRWTGKEPFDMKLVKKVMVRTRVPRVGLGFLTGSGFGNSLGGILHGETAEVWRNYYHAGYRCVHCTHEWTNTVHHDVEEFEISDPIYPQPQAPPPPPPRPPVRPQPQARPAAPAVRRCASCGTPFTPNAKFCAECGRKT